MELNQNVKLETGEILKLHCTLDDDPSLPSFAWEQWLQLPNTDHTIARPRGLCIRWCSTFCICGFRLIDWSALCGWKGSRIISPRALDPRTLGPRTLDPRHPKSQGPVILGPMVLRTISPGILGPWKPWPLGPKVLWLKVLGPMVQGT